MMSFLFFVMFPVICWAGLLLHGIQKKSSTVKLIALVIIIVILGFLYCVWYMINAIFGGKDKGLSRIKLYKKKD